MKKILLTVLSAVLFFAACEKETPLDDPQPKPTGKIVFKFLHHVDGEALAVDTMKYINQAGNAYEVNEVQWFISNVVLHKDDGTFYRIGEWTRIHYVDIDIPSTLTWQVFDKIPAGSYTGISFTFGLDEETNKSFLFVNPPESFMFWPEVLGGGYHYLKLNGKWKDPQQAVRFFNFHTGIGQIVSATDTTFVHNHFDVSFNNSPFTIVDNATKEIRITMNIENWFKNPHVYDHNVWGGDIMENQAAMEVASENGVDVFSLSFDCCNK